ncbi:MAG: hypothetical protein RR709_07975 [Ruthenibacterium sp.]
MIQGERYVLDKNEKPVKVYGPDDKPHTLFGAKNNDYMFRFIVDKQLMHARFFHGLCNIKGFEPFLKTVLFEYFNRTENRLHFVKDVNTIASPIAEEELKDPCWGKTFEGDCASAQPLNEVYRLPEELDPLGRCFSYKLEMNEDVFMAFTKASDGSPNAIIALLMANAILAENPQASDRIVSGIAMDAHHVVGAEKAHHALLRLLKLHHSKKLSAMPFSTQATCYRGMIFLQSDAEHSFPELRASNQIGEMIQSMPTLEAKRNLARSAILSNLGATTFDVSYAGAMDFGEINSYIKSVYASADIKHQKMMIEISCVNHKFFINIMQSFETDRYVKAMVKQLKAANISCKCKEVEMMESMIADSPLI